jgi:ADP-heptose:LPS heptosyltransferase
LVAHLASLPAQVFLDVGAPGGEEEARVRAAVAAAGEAGERLGLHAGSFASFAAMIAASRCYAGYDSAGQHVAAALGVPVVTVFRGFPCERMLARWTPSGPGPVTLLRADRFQDHQDLLRAVRDAIKL